VERGRQDTVSNHAARAFVNPRDRWLFWGIVALGLALRIVYVAQLRGSPLFAAPQMDAAIHDQWARAIAAGGEFWDGPFFRAPLYPYFLATIYKVCGPGYLAPRLAQALLGALSCGLVFLIGLRAFGRREGVLSGIAAATYWVLIYFDAELLIPPLIVFLDLLLILVLLQAQARPGRLIFGAAGLLLGLSAVARPNILLFAPAIALWTLLVRGRPWRRSLVHVAALVLGCLLPILPVTMHNVLRGGDWVLISSQGGVNFYIGNNPASDGATAIVPGTPGDWWGGYHATIARAEEAAGRHLKPSEVSRYYERQAWEFIRREPGRALELLGRKLWLFWNGREISNNQDPYFWTERTTPVVRWLPLNFAIVGPLGLLGLVCCWSRKRELFPLWGFVLVYMISVIAFFCTARYRVPVLAPLLILAAAAFFCLFDAVRGRRWGTVARYGCVLVPAFLLVNGVPGEADPTHGAQSLRLLAKAYEEQGRHDLALGPCREAVQADPRSLSARYDLGTALLRLDRPSEAAAELEAALGLNPDPRRGETELNVARVHHNLANALRRLGEIDSALDHYRQAIAHAGVGDEALFHYNLGTTLLTAGQPRDAAAALQRAVELDPQLQAGYYNLAWAQARAGDWDAASCSFQQAVQLNPADAQAWHGLGQVRLRQDLADEAIAAFVHAAQLVPRNAGILADLAGAQQATGRYAEARETLERGLDLDDPDLVNDLVWLLATCPRADLRNGAQAVELAERLCPDPAGCGPNALDTLAAALAEAGRFPRAVQVARLALERARTEGLESLAASILARLRLYESKRPYHEPAMHE
jgi:tetratricopeptide (TPR) repeat protein/4-amino-4-deoxy-L-arabinose transferase-like glycosyltransferase